MHTSILNLERIKNEINHRISKNKLNYKKFNIIAVSKTFGIDKIEPLLKYGHNHFGENKVQEALEKWSNIKKTNNNIKLHMIGKLQTNKVKHVVPLFDFIHSLDNYKLAKKISEEEKKYNKKLKIFIQINIGMENQKSGLNSDDLKDFYNHCVNDLELDIIGLMCLPPNDNKTDIYFKKMKNLSLEYKFDNLSMGMSNDYLYAVDYGANFIRIGSKIFGNRN